MSAALAVIAPLSGLAEARQADDDYDIAGLSERTPAEHELDVAAGIAQQLWHADVVRVLVERARPDDLALAALLSSLDMLFVGEACSVNTDAASSDTLGCSPASKRVLLDAALEDAEAVSLTLLRPLLSKHLRELDPADQDRHVDLVIGRAPTDVSGWLLKLELLQQRKASPDQIDATLAAAAREVSGSSEWFHSFAQVLDGALARVPMPELMVEQADSMHQPGSGWQAPPTSEPELRMQYALGLVFALMPNNYQSIFQACPPSLSVQDLRRSDCIALARAFATGSTTIIERQLGLSIWHRLVEGTASESEVLRRKRQHYWQVEQSMERQRVALECGDGTEQLTQAIREPGSSELSALEAAMQGARIPTEPPPQWLPQNPDVLRARR